MADGKLVTCDLICLGAASPGVFQTYIRWLEETAGRKIVEYAHRGKGEQWGVYEEQVCFANGVVETATTRTRVWKRIWSQYCLRPSCYRCLYHSIKRPGDLTIGDYWGIDSAHPGAKDEFGISCLLANNALGMGVVRSLGGKVALLPSSISKCANASQPMLLEAPKVPERRLSFWQNLHEGGFAAACKGVGAMGFTRAVKDSIKSGLACIRSSSCKSESVSEVETDGSKWVEVEAEMDTVEYSVVFAAKNKSDEIRRKSSSGGMFHALAEYAIERGGVVYGCAFDDELKARHIRCETIEECERCMGSKYSQSDMGETIRAVRDDLEEGRFVLFTGTPCQVDAVRHACGNLRGGGYSPEY